MTTLPEAPPTHSDELDDVLLMRLHDGDLSGEEEEAVRARLEGSSAAQRKLGSLKELGDVLRTGEGRAARLDGLADAVMAAIDAGDEAARPAALGPAVHAERRTRRESPETPGNDNARSIFAVAGLAAAAAAALFVWGRTETADLDLVRAPIPEAPLAAEMPTTLAQASASEEAGAEAETAELAPGETGVEVASVEFGSQQGSVFYVPGNGAATAVVWINDAGDEP